MNTFNPTHEATPSHGTPERAADLIAPGETLSRQHNKEYKVKLTFVVLTTMLTIASSCGLALLTMGVLTRLLPDALAFVAATAVHFALASGVHLLVVGAHRRSKTEKGWGLFLTFLSLATLIGISVARSFVMIEEGRAPGSAWLLSLGLLMIEVVVPLALGFLGGTLWIQMTSTGEEAKFYRKLHQQLLSRNPAKAWVDAIGRTAHDLQDVHSQSQSASPDKMPALQDQAVLLDTRLKTLKEWSPVSDYSANDEYSTPSTPMSEMPLSHGNSHPTPPLTMRQRHEDTRALSRHG